MMVHFAQPALQQSQIAFKLNIGKHPCILTWPWKDVHAKRIRVVKKFVQSTQDFASIGAKIRYECRVFLLQRHPKRHGAYSVTNERTLRVEPVQSRTERHQASTAVRSQRQHRQQRQNDQTDTLVDPAC